MARDHSAGSEQLSAEIDTLQSETIPQLRQRWKELYATEPPPRASRDLLMRAVADRLMSVKDRYYKGEYPAWTGVGVTALAMPGLMVEIKCVAIPAGMGSVGSAALPRRRRSD
jgi:hypothetical protein